MNWDSKAASGGELTRRGARERSAKEEALETRKAYQRLVQ